jgi:hypothetical protein
MGFLHVRLMKNIVWIASYPKSGNTWVRFMACNLLYGRQESASTLNLHAPDVHEVGANLNGHAGLAKTHFIYSARLPLVEKTVAAIYVVREPADVLLSNFYYAQRSAGRSDDTRDAFDRYFDAFILNRGDPRWSQSGMGSWEDNVRSWLVAGQSFPVLTIRYEDLSTDPRGVCAMMAQMLRPGISALEIDAAVADSSFQRMREIEDADIREKRIGIFYKPYLQASIESGKRFMRRGVVGDGTRRLAPDQRTRLYEAFAPLLVELGYSAD